MGRSVFVKCDHCGVYIYSIQTLSLKFFVTALIVCWGSFHLRLQPDIAVQEQTPSQEVHKYIVKLVLGFLCIVWGHEYRRFAWCKESEVVLAFKVAEFQIALDMAYWLVGNKPAAWPVLFWDEWKNTRDRMEADTNTVFKLNRSNLLHVLETLLNECAWYIHCTD